MHAISACIRLMSGHAFVVAMGLVVAMLALGTFSVIRMSGLALGGG